MGGFGRRNRKKARCNKDRNLEGKNVSSRADYVGIELKNEKFESYYCGTIIPESEWESFYTKMQEPLPVTFRIPDSIFSSTLESYLQTKYPFLEKIAWYSGPGSAWKVSAGRTQVRRDPLYADLHTLLVRETEVGNICRQEAVSMIPPLFLKVCSTDIILDMCAAPGSKTCQLIEALHYDVNYRNLSAGFLIPRGVVVANDVDVGRASMMVHQVKRMNSPSLVVTTLDASQFPTHFKFDKILCDVPCSGDGTLRKNKLIWRTWNQRHAEALQPLQISILDRGLSLLRPGGKLVYSTCSLNPMENERVIEAVLMKNSIDYELVDCSDMLPGLKKLPGLKFTSNIPLERCMRFYPHLQDTGGFFIAVIQKITSNQLKETVISQKIDRPIECIENTYIRSAFDQWHFNESIKLGEYLISRQITNQENEKQLLPQLYLLSETGRAFISLISGNQQHQILYFGLAAFSRQDKNELYRIKYPALPFVVPFLDPSVIIDIKDPTDIHLLLSPIDGKQEEIAFESSGYAAGEKDKEETNAKSGELAQSEEKSHTDQQAILFYKFTPGLQELLSPLTVKCYVAKMHFNHQLAIFVPLWKGRFSAHLLVGKFDKASLSFFFTILKRVTF